MVPCSSLVWSIAIGRGEFSALIFEVFMTKACGSDRENL